MMLKPENVKLSSTQVVEEMQIDSSVKNNVKDNVVDLEEEVVYIFNYDYSTTTNCKISRCL